MGEHTKAPWTLSRGGGHMPSRIIGAALAKTHHGSWSEEVCRFQADLSMPEPAANARLIAAAPSLLEAAEYAVEHLHLGWSGDPDCESCTAIGGLREAIARAKGEDA